MNILDKSNERNILAWSPVGTIVEWIGQDIIPPQGWLFCNGNVYNRSQYTLLYDILAQNVLISKTDSTFILPDLTQTIGGFIVRKIIKYAN